MSAFTARPIGRKGCQVSRVVQRRACQRLAVKVRDTGSHKINLCEPCDARYGEAIGKLALYDGINYVCEVNRS